jgi:LysR family glycine cleavage system transcriptional activator
LGGVEQQLLFHDDVVVVAAPHFNRGRSPQTPQQIVDSPIIYNTESWLPWCEAGRRDGRERKGLCSNDSNLVLEAVRLGQGIALERRSLVHDAIERGAGAVERCQRAYAYPYWLVWPPRERSEGKQREFSQWLSGEVERYLGQLKAPT